MKKILLFITISVSLVSSMCLTNTIEIINIPVGKSLVVAGEQSVVDNNAFNVVSNPAVLYVSSLENMLEFNRLFYFADTNYDNIGLLFKKYGVGFVVNRFSSGEFEIRDIDGVKTNTTIEYTTTILNLGISTVLTSYNTNSKLYGGISGFLLWERIVSDTKLYGVNIGLLYEHNFSTKFFKLLRLGYVIKGIGVTDKPIYHCGILLRFGSLSLISGYEGKLKTETYGKTKLGFEFDFELPYTSYTASLNLGYNFGKDEKQNFVTYGIKIKIDNIILQCGSIYHEYLDTVYSLYFGIEL